LVKLQNSYVYLSLTSIQKFVEAKYQVIKTAEDCTWKKDELKKCLVKHPILTHQEIGHIADKYVEKRSPRRRF